MDGKKQFRFPDSSVWQIIGFAFAMIVIGLFVFLLQLDYFQQIRTEAAVRVILCTNNLNCIGNEMHEVSSKEGFELPPEWTVADLIQADVRKQMELKSVSLKGVFCCSKNKQPYLVFPVSASVALDKSLQPPVPILMCPPGAHGKRGTPVLYSDGSVKRLTPEEAEKLVSDQSPVPLRIDFETKPEEGER